MKLDLPVIAMNVCSVIVKVQFVCTYVCQCMYLINLCKFFIAPNPRIFIKPNYSRQPTIGEPHDLICLIALSSTAQSSSVNLAWNFTSNDDRVTVIPTTITTDDSIGIVYTTVIQFDYLIEGDEENYTCNLTIGGDSAESTFNLEIISMYNCLIYTL